MSAIVERPSAVVLEFALTSSLASYTGADDSTSPVDRAYSDIDIGLLTIVGSLATILFLGRPFGAAITLFLKMIGYSVRLILELETDEASYEDGVDDRLSDHDLATTNCLGLWQ
jgi:hypothetical protein